MSPQTTMASLPSQAEDSTQLMLLNTSEPIHTLSPWCLAECCPALPGWWCPSNSRPFGPRECSAREPAYRWADFRCRNRARALSQCHLAGTAGFSKHERKRPIEYSRTDRDIRKFPGSYHDKPRSCPSTKLGSVGSSDARLSDGCSRSANKPSTRQYFGLACLISVLRRISLIYSPQLPTLRPWRPTQSYSGTHSTFP